MAAKVLALSAVDLLIDPELLERARTFFLEQNQGKPYESPIPIDQKPPLPAPRPEP